MKTLIDRESIFFVALLVATMGVVYFTSNYVQLFFFLFLLIVFFFSKKEYFWLAYFSVVLFETGGFFVKDMFINFGSIPISLVIFVSIIFSFKGFRKYRNQIYLFKRLFFLWFGYLVFLLILGIVFYGLEGGGATGFRWIFFLGSFIVCIPSIFYIPRYFVNYLFLKRFSRLIFIALVINLFGQIFHIKNGLPMFLIYKPELANEQIETLDFTQVLVRPVWGHWICFIALFLALYFYVRDDKSFKKTLLILAIFISYISIFIGATRGWFLAFMFILIIFIIVYSTGKNIGLVILTVFTFITLSLLLYNFSSAFKIQTDLVTERLLTLELMLEGDITAGGTMSRLTDRSDKVMEVFNKHPIFGNGFSTEAFTVNDAHVGNQNILMEGGVVGFIINMFMWIYVLFIAYKYHTRSKSNKSYNRELLLIMIVMLGLFIIHSSSSAIFGYLILVSHPAKFLFIPIIYGIIHSILLINRRETLKLA